MTADYERARSAAQKAERAEQILAAASEMLTESLDSANLSLNELARRAGMSKSNVYRYFESREAVLLALLDQANQEWSRTCVDALARVPSDGSVEARLESVARILAGVIAARPVMCHLSAVLGTVLERNVEYDTVRDFKLSAAALALRVAEAMHGAVPELPVEQHGELLGHCFSYLTGAWPFAHPNEVVRKVLDDHELTAFQHDFERDLRRACLLLARGMWAMSAD